MPTPPTALKIVFGCMTFGKEGAEMARVHDLSACQTILDTFASHGHTEIDTARMYGGGSSEEYLAALGALQRFQVATKVFPSARMSGALAAGGYTHTAAGVQRSLDESLHALGADSIDLFYLHAPDRQVPFAETLEAVNAAHKAGKFTRFGISNYTAAEVDEIVALCKQNNWLPPSVYQGLYNVITRSAEPDLFPVLRKHNIAFYAFNPLGGGLFTGAYNPQATVQSGSRFDPDRTQGKLYRSRYWNDTYFRALEQIRPVAEKHGLRLSEVALRWIVHHSILNKQHGDAVIIGASSTNHIEQNLKDFELGPLDKEVVEAVDRAWETVKPNAPKYHH